LKKMFGSKMSDCSIVISSNTNQTLIEAIVISYSVHQILEGESNYVSYLASKTCLSLISNLGHNTD